MDSFTLATIISRIFFVSSALILGSQTDSILGALHGLFHFSNDHFTNLFRLFRTHHITVRVLSWSSSRVIFHGFLLIHFPKSIFPHLKKLCSFQQIFGILIIEPICEIVKILVNAVSWSLQNSVIQFEYSLVISNFLLPFNKTVPHFITLPLSAALGNCSVVQRSHSFWIFFGHNLHVTQIVDPEVHRQRNGRNSFFKHFKNSFFCTISLFKVCIFLPVSITVWVTVEESVEHFSSNLGLIFVVNILKKMSPTCEIRRIILDYFPKLFKFSLLCIFGSFLCFNLFQSFFRNFGLFCWWFLSCFWNWDVLTVITS